MRAEDKEVDGRDLEREQRESESELEGQDEDVLPEADLASAFEAEYRGQVLAAMRAILERQQIVVESLQLPQRELRALEALKAAVDGRDHQLSQFVYASDRRHLLEQALAVLQPNAVELAGAFHEVVQRVGALRHDLKELEDSQDELLEGHQKAALAKADGDTDDKPKPPDDVAAPAGSTLSGPELAPEPEAASSLYGAEDPPQPKAATTLVGPEVPAQPAQASTLGDPAELEAQAKKPWWRRPFGG